MAKILMIVLLLLILGIAGFGGWLFATGRLDLLLNPPPTETAEEQPQQQRRAQEPEPPRRSDEPVFLDMGQLQFPIIDNGRIVQTINLHIILDVANPEVRSRLVATQSRVRDALMEEMWGALQAGEVMSGNIVEVSLVKNRLQRLLDDRLGRGHVVDVLINSVAQRRF